MVDRAEMHVRNGIQPYPAAEPSHGHLRFPFHALINRLVKWLKTAGISDSQILDCITYITDTGRAQNGEKKKPAETLNK